MLQGERLGGREPRLAEKVTVITGGNQGLGRAFAEAFAAEGAWLVLAARNEPVLTQTALELTDARATVLPVVCDVGSEEAVEQLFQQAAERFGRVDILINNAAISGPTCPVHQLSLGEWNQTLAIDLTGQFLCSREAAKLMIPRQAGVILNIASVFGPKRGYPLRAAYAAAKAALVSLTQTMALELGPHGIRVNAVCPGPVEGERIERVWKARAEARGHSVEAMRRKMLQMAALRRIPTARECADLALFLCSDAASAITGQAINLTAGMEMR